MKCLKCLKCNYPMTPIGEVRLKDDDKGLLYLCLECGNGVVMNDFFIH